VRVCGNPAFIAVINLPQMHMRWAVFFLAILASQPLLAENDDSPPVPISQPEPEYGPELSKYYLLTPTRITLVIDDQGIPLSLSPTSSLSDNIISAISRWRFRSGKKDGANVPSSMTLMYPVRTLLDAAHERTVQRRPSYLTKDLAKAMESGTGLDSGQAEVLEQNLATDAKSVEARSNLLIYSTETAATNSKDAAERRARQIEFLVQNLPEERVLANPLVTINSTAGPLPDPEAYRQVRNLWLQQLSSKPIDPIILEHATYFLRISDPEKTEQLLLPALKEVPDALIWLGDLYGLAILGVNGLDLKTGLAVSAGPSLPVTEFARKARSGLMASTTDLKILLSALNTFTANGRSLIRASALPDGYAPLCQQLLAQVKELYPNTAISCDPSTAAPENVAPFLPGPPQRIRVGGNVQQANLIKKVTPEYPPDAKSRGIQGVVRFTALINKNGTIANLTLVSGPLPLYKSAHDAVLRWTYRPTTLNRTPVEVVTTIDVNYTLSR
jgi:TonB family protein